MIVHSKTLCAFPDIAHGFSTREGGVSGGIYTSLNCGGGSKDNPDHVKENRRLFAQALGAGKSPLVSPYQVHSADAVVVEEPWARADAPKADAVVTAKPGLAIAISTADCVPVLFVDSQAKIVGAAHSGWRGALTGILEATLDAMVHLGAERSRISTFIGPAISQSAYEVGDEFKETFLKEDETSERFFQQLNEQERPHFDLTGYVAARLQSAGACQVENLELCTYQDTERFFSYRRSCHQDEADYGRQISAIMIK